MSHSVAEREALWDKFLELWPLGSLKDMRLVDYNHAGSNDSFCRWLEKHTESLGSIWGGSSLKFGIYCRANSDKDPSEQPGVACTDQYAWYRKHGESPDEAFSRVREAIVAAATAAAEGRLDAIEAIDLWPILKWKIAFLYQNRLQPSILPIFLGKYLKAVAGDNPPTLHSELYSLLMKKRGESSLWDYADQLLEQAEQVLEKVPQQLVLQHFKAINDLAARLDRSKATKPFCDLVLALRERGMDWWVTSAGVIHAGRTEDYRTWQTVLAVRVDVGANVTRAALNGAGEHEWQILDDTLVDALVDAVAPIKLPLTSREPYWPDDYDKMSDRLVVTLTEGAIRNGYLSVPKSQLVIPEDCISEGDEPARRFLSLRLPNGDQLQTQVLSKYKRLQARFNALFAAEALRPGALAVLTKLGDYDFELSFARGVESDSSHMNDVTALGKVAASSSAPLNQILFGPPGTGKTYETINAALEILDPVYLADNSNDRPALKTRFDKLAAEGRIRFVTFHQSFSYEDFVEGLRAESDAASGQLRYEVVDGVFKSLCELASAKITQRAEAPVDIGLRRVWKMSLGNTLGSDASIFEECLKGNYVLLGYGAHIDFSGCASRSEVQQRFADGGVQLDGPNDYSLTSVAAFVTKMKPGDLVVVSDGNFKFRAIGEITGDYAFKPHSEYEADYAQMRPVKWLRQYAPSLPHTELLEGQFSQMTLYELRSPTLNREKLQALLGAPVESADGLFAVGQRFGQGYVVRSVGPEVVEFDKPKGGVLPLPLSLVRQLLAYVRSGLLEVEDIRKGRVFEKVAEAELEKYIVNGYQHLFAALVEQLMQPKLATTPDARVLIIDEINRGNVSRIFGELITLIEESKRAGSPEALEVILPYSKKPFSLPNNLYLIGTMNTADRSLAGLDLALRRRFTFREMPPKPELLHGVMVEGVDIGQLLAEMNARIEVLLDRDHRIGHAYFIALKDNEDKRTLAHLAAIFRQKVLPLLQEYFFEDWERIQWVLNDHRKAGEDRFVLSKDNVSQALFGPGVQLPARAAAWYLNEAAFDRVQAYRGIISAQAPALSAEAHLQAATAQVVSEFAAPADEQSA